MSAGVAVKPQGRAELPRGWRWVRLNEICVQDRQVVYPNGTLSERTYLSLEHVESETGRILRAAGANAKGEGRSTAFAFDSRHVLYGKLRPYLNKVALPNFEGRCTTELIPLLPTGEVDRAYLAWFLRRPETVHAAMQGKTGSRMPRADIEKLLRLELPLPPLETQKRIANLLTEQMEAVERAGVAAEEQLEAARKLKSAFLVQIFNELTETDIVQLGSVLSNIQAGKSIQCIERPAKPDEWGVLKVSAVSWGLFDRKRIRFCLLVFWTPSDSR